MINNILDCVELFNVCEAQKCDKGYILNRYPEEIQKYMSVRGSWIASMSCGSEIRFVKTEPGVVRVCLFAERGDCPAVLYRGDRVEKNFVIKDGEYYNLEIDANGSDTVNNPEFFANDVFSKDVVRIVLFSSRVILSSIETYGRTIRKPNADELPKKTIFAYGSSITHGTAAINAPLTYISTAARQLKCQVMNKGLGGACFNEKEVADFFADNIKYDYMIYECGTNMIDDYPLDEIEKRCTYLLKKMFEKNPDKKVFVLTPPVPRIRYDRPEFYGDLMNTVKKIHENVDNKNCIFINSEQFEDSTAYVTTDIIHPSTEGHFMMGLNLAEIIKKYI